ncbi:DEAD/DEAH box helicase [Synechocystis sp. LKSZ1]|uniref:DEAD/DEAH box helicase n=1 Tax=Synechocystis sp. LKSZ1 TaxID=3144951 RepID=UPI00336C12A2
MNNHGYGLYQIPSEGGNFLDTAWVKGPTDNSFTHLAYTVETTHRKNNVLARRSINFNELMPNSYMKDNFPKLLERLKEQKTYQVGENVITDEGIKTEDQISTILRLGALELLANIHSGRITASDKDPFPHQLALQQYVKNNESRVKRILIADEVGLGKTIEVGLILRDRMISQSNDFRCLYLTPGGLKEDVKEKLSSVIKSPEGNEIIKVIDSFKDYGRNISTNGICIASIDAAKRYLKSKDKAKLQARVRPNILIIDECHHCSSSSDLRGKEPKDIACKKSTQAYKAALQIITGEYWTDSEPPELVILMSATPFRSESQFTNLLRLLAHQTVVDDAFSKEMDKEELLKVIKQEDSPVTIIWRQQDEIHSWTSNKLFPKLTIRRPHSDENVPPLAKVDEDYLHSLRKIKIAIRDIYAKHSENFGGFSTAHLETVLTSSSLAGACWIFRWCVRHHPGWQNDTVYRADTSEETEKLRELIREISKKMASFDENRELEYAKEVKFPSDSNFTFESSHLKGTIPKIREFHRELRNQDEEDPFIADAYEIVELADLALNLLRSNGIVENAKIDWLKQMLKEYPDSRFLVFTESLQTTAVITATFQKESLALVGSMSQSERQEAVRKFYDTRKKYRILVATSAADEGLDFQIANKVVHWDLSPDPSVLMQRNGRVARLGQISDVTAYYLILEGTLAHTRDSTLLTRLKSAGITDPKLIEKIYGRVLPELEKIELEEIEEGTIDEIIRKAKEINDFMEHQFRELREEQLNAEFVVGRDELMKRLKNWMRLDYSKYDLYKHQIQFETREWQRPIFTENGTSSENYQSEILSIASTRGVEERYIVDKQKSKSPKKFIFDQEFGLFGQEKNIDGLAGLLPWDVPSQDLELRRYQSNRSKDYLGSLCETLARQRNADFAVIARSSLCEKFSYLSDAKFLLFSTHPLRELESLDCSNVAKYLTYYAFADDFNQPINFPGASATQVHEMISFLECEAIKGLRSPLTNEIYTLKSASTQITKWVVDNFSIPSFDNDSYFVPIPVSLIAIYDDIYLQ